MLRIGLTGGIGSGKSTVAARLVQCGAALVDTDAIARRLTAPGGRALPALAAAFGPSILEAGGGLDRPRMRALAFEDSPARARLEAILHPMIGADAAREADAAASAGAPAVVFDVPLLAESGIWRGRVERIVVVDCRVQTQLERVAARPGWSIEAARAVVARQATRAERRALADAVIANDAIGLATLHDEVDALWRSWCGGPL